MVSDRILSIAQVYMAAYSCEISIIAALVIGAGIGAYVAFQYCRDDWDNGFTDGYQIGTEVGKQKKRDPKGRFAK